MSGYCGSEDELLASLREKTQQFTALLISILIILLFCRPTTLLLALGECSFPVCLVFRTFFPPFTKFC